MSERDHHLDPTLSPAFDPYLPFPPRFDHRRHPRPTSLPPPSRKPKPGRPPRKPRPTKSRPRPHPQPSKKPPPKPIKRPPPKPTKKPTKKPTTKPSKSSRTRTRTRTSSTTRHSTRTRPTITPAPTASGTFIPPPLPSSASFSSGTLTFSQSGSSPSSATPPSTTAPSLLPTDSDGNPTPLTPPPSKVSGEKSSLPVILGAIFGALALFALILLALIFYRRKRAKETQEEALMDEGRSEMGERPRTAFRHESFMALVKDAAQSFYVPVPGPGGPASAGAGADSSLDRVTSDILIPASPSTFAMTSSHGGSPAVGPTGTHSSSPAAASALARQTSSRSARSLSEQSLKYLEIHNAGSSSPASPPHKHLHP